MTVRVTLGDGDDSGAGRSEPVTAQLLGAHTWPPGTGPPGTCACAARAQAACMGESLAAEPVLNETWAVQGPGGGRLHGRAGPLLLDHTLSPSHGGGWPVHLPLLHSALGHQQQVPWTKGQKDQ